MKSLIDYREYDKGAAATNLPSMKDSFSEIPYEGKDLIVKYLDNGRKTAAAVGRAKDAFTGEEIPGEYYMMTDGEYSWISSLSYYVEKYNLRLPQIFEEKVMSLARDEVAFHEYLKRNSNS